MIKDINQKNDLNKLWKNSNENLLKFEILILDYQNWSTFEPSNMKLTNQMKEVQNKFTLLYNEKNSSRKLNWLLNLGNVKVNLIKSKYTYECTCYFFH
jgi:hypothetical protein